MSEFEQNYEGDPSTEPRMEKTEFLERVAELDRRYREGDPTLAVYSRLSPEHEFTRRQLSEGGESWQA